MTAPADHTSALLHDIELSRRIQTFCTWCGPAFVVLLFGGWGLLDGFIPLIPASYSTEQVARRLRRRRHPAQGRDAAGIDRVSS